MQAASAGGGRCRIANACSRRQRHWMRLSLKWIIQSHDFH
jgi:hypothetical protein